MFRGVVVVLLGGGIVVWAVFFELRQASEILPGDSLDDQILVGGEIVPRRGLSASPGWKPGGAGENATIVAT